MSENNTSLSYSSDSTILFNDNDNDNHKFINDFNSIIESFWNEKVWKSNPMFLSHKKIYKIISEHQKLTKKLTHNTKNNDDSSNIKFNINDNFDFFVVDTVSDLKEKLAKHFENNIMFIKTHSECFINYNKLQNNYFYIKNLDYNPSFVKLNIPNNVSTNDILMDKSSTFTNKISDIYNFDEFKTFLDFDSIKINVIINELSNILSIHENNINLAINQSINKNKKILIIDSENILKCFKIQYLIKKLFTQKEYEKYFDTWINGNYHEFDDVCSSNLSLTEYSSNIKFIEPYTSLSMNTNIKFSLLKKIIESVFSDYICIAICNSKIFSNDILFDTSINNSIFIPISYDKKDIREKDDHLLVYLYYYLTKKNIPFHLLSGDKFKWCSFISSDNPIKNVKYLFNFDDNLIEYTLNNAYDNNSIKINNKIHFLSINYFPASSFDNNLDSNNYIHQLTNFFINKSFNVDNKSNTSNSNNEYNQLLQDIYNHIKIWCNEFSIIFSFLEKYSKSEIFKILKKINQNNFKYKQIDFERFRLKIDEYKQICDMYVIIKHININFNSYLNHKNHLLTCKIFSRIVEVNDSIYTNMFKIRKLSSNRQSINLFFMELGSLFVYSKKIGFFKKQL